MANLHRMQQEAGAIVALYTEASCLAPFNRFWKESLQPFVICGQQELMTLLVRLRRGRGGGGGSLRSDQLPESDLPAGLQGQDVRTQMLLHQLPGIEAERGLSVSMPSTGRDRDPRMDSYRRDFGCGNFKQHLAPRQVPSPRAVHSRGRMSTGKWLQQTGAPPCVNAAVSSASLP